MHAWEHALAEFIAPYRARRDVVGALACGSYVTGAPSPRSDIDVVIVLAPGTRYRERGNRIVRGFLFEYFANPPVQFRAYFKKAYEANRQDTATMFATGRVLFDRSGAVRQLREHARRWLARPPRKPSRATLATERYFLWDSLDNMCDLYERETPAFAHAYHHHVQDVYALYARALQQPVQRPRQLHAYLTSAKARRKYLLQAFPDRRFVALLLAALVASERTAMLRAAQALTEYAIRRLGGFEVDGFVLRTALVL